MTKEELINGLEEAILNQDQNILQDLSRQALSSFPEETFGYEYALKLLLAQDDKDFGSIESCYIRLIQINDDNIQYQEALAEIKMEQGAIEDAASIYAGIFEEDKNNLKAITGLGLYLLMEKENPEAAIPYLEIALAHDDKESVHYIYLATAYKNTDNLNKALAVLEVGLEENFDVSLCTLKIELLNELKRPEDTVEVYFALIHNYPEVLGYQYNLAITLDDLGRYNTAISHYQKAIEIAENQDVVTSALYLGYGKVSLRVGNYDQAIDAINKSIALDDNHLTQIALLEALNGAEKYTDVITKAKTMLSEDGVGNMTQELIYKELGIAYIGLEDWAKARTIFKKINDDFSSKAAGNFGLGLLAMKEENDFPKAITMLKNSMDMGYKAARYYIEDHLSEKINSFKSELLNQYKAPKDIGVSPELMNKVLVFKGVMSKDGWNKKSFLNRVFHNCIFFVNATGGFILYNNGTLDAFIYKHGDEDNPFELELVYVDGKYSKQATLSDGDGDLYYQYTSENKLAFAPLTEANDTIKTLIYKYVNLSFLDYLGKDAIDSIQNMLK